MDCSYQTMAGGGPAEDVEGVLMSSGRREPFMESTGTPRQRAKGACRPRGVGCRDPSRGESNPRGSALQQVQWQANALRYRGRSTHCYTP